MDPKACLELAGIAHADGDSDEARERLADYVAWRSRGGFEPTLESGMRGDEFAGRLARSLARHAS